MNLSLARYLSFSTRLQQILQRSTWIQRISPSCWRSPRSRRIAPSPFDSVGEGQLHFLVPQATEAIFAVDREGIITDVNPFALDSLLYRADELLDYGISAIDLRLTPATYRARWKELQAGASLTFETVYRRKDGRTYPVEVRCNPIYKDGQMLALHVARNISERQAAQATQARLAEIGELAATVVHEIRNPLTSIYLALTGMQRLNLPYSGRSRLKLALEEAERLKRLLNEILTYSKEQQLRDECVEINGLCRELHPLLRELPAAAGRQIQLTTAPQALVAKGDRDKLKQVSINLVTNACEAIAPGETVRWTIRRAAQQIEIQIHNGGEPIPPEILPQLTQPFVSTKTTGNGLGLAITKRIIEAHGGSLAITSNATAGTTVTVLLPES